MLSLGLERLSEAGRPRALGPWGGLLIRGGQGGGRVAACVQSGQHCRSGDRSAGEPVDHLAIGGPKAALMGDPQQGPVYFQPISAYHASRV